MEKSAEILEKVVITLEKYKKNKTLVSPEDLAGRYKVPFTKLKQQLADELSDYLKAYSLEQLVLVQDSEGRFDNFVKDVNRLFKESEMGKKVGKAAFKEFDLEYIKHYAEELRCMVYEKAWIPYFNQYVCLYASAECFAENNPQTPRIYNSLVDKFWNQEVGAWIEDKTAVKPAILIYIQKGKSE